MTRRARIAILLTPLVLSLLALAASPPAAGADGLPVLGVDARPIEAPGDEVAYVTRRAREGTALEVIDADSERRLRRVILPGRLSVPAVAYDATPSGLSADGRTLVLINPRRRFPRASTQFALVDTRTLGIRRRLRLKGDFSFDALSPDARTMYLIHYPSPNNVQRYDVRAYDLRSERLLPRPIVDPREPDERMSGTPITRSTGPGARWEYTLYQGPEYAFIHALDTQRREAFCIDLEGLDGYPGGMWGLKLESGSDTLAVVAGRRRLATVDTDTLEPEVAGARPAAAPSEDEPKSAGVPWLLVLAPTLLLFAGLALLGRRGHQAANA